MPRKKTVDHPDDIDVDLAPLVSPSQLAELHALGYRGPTPSTEPQAAALLRQWQRPAPVCPQDPGEPQGPQQDGTADAPRQGSEGHAGR